MTVAKLSGLLAAERRIAALARTQHGVVARQQLTALGISARVIDNRVQAGWLRPLHRGVYLVGPTEGRLSREMAAVFACGDGAALSHASAAALWSLLPQPARDQPIDVTVPARRGPRRSGIRIHRAGLRSDEVTRVGGIPVTAPARTLLDLASVASTAELEQAVGKALVTRQVSKGKLRGLLARYPRRPGCARLRGFLEASPAMTPSEAERHLLRLIRRARLPEPDVNVVLDVYEVDFLWREERLIAEMDGFEYHSSRRSFEADRRRDAELAARGLTVIRITWRQLRDEPEAIVARLARALERRAR